ncbi:MAG TPA: toprim domain-containing protein, partial [Anaerolineaceae bacterium]
MAVIPEPVQNLINAFSRLPGIGPKTASRLTFYLLRGSDDLSLSLAEALVKLKSGTSFCRVCFNITLADEPLCEICANPKRDGSIICVVEDPLDVLVLEKTGGYEGRYHVLHGLLSPIEGIGPDQIKIRPLIERVKESPVR